MKVLHVSTSDNGGAAIACFRLHKALLNLGIDSKVLVYLKKRGDLSIPEIYYYHNENPLLKPLRYAKFAFHPALNKYRIKGRPSGYEIFTSPNSCVSLASHQLFYWADIVNLHWVSYAMDYKKFFSTARQPLVWTLHDMNPFTGGCHYAGECLGYENSCQSCPQLQGAFSNIISERFLQNKIAAFVTKPNLSIVTPSNWLMEKSEKSLLFRGLPHFEINNSCDENIFYLRKKHESRELMGVPKEKTCLLFVADSLSNHRKGFAHLLQTLQKVQDKSSICLCVVGRGDVQSIAQSDFQTIQFGMIDDENSMALLYSLADYFVIPSLEDNLPNTIVESLMCGTPVIGFPVGGIKEMIQHEVNGFLARETSVDGLYETIKTATSSFDLFNREEISKQARKHYSSTCQATKYHNLYKSIIALQ